MITLFDASGAILGIVAISCAIAVAMLAGSLSARLFLGATRESVKGP